MGAVKAMRLERRDLDVDRGTLEIRPKPFLLPGFVVAPREPPERAPGFFEP